MRQQWQRHTQRLHPHPGDPTQLSRAVMSPTAQTALSTQKSQLDSYAFVKADSAGAHSCLFSAAGTNTSLLAQSRGCWEGCYCSTGPQNGLPGSARCSGPSRFALPESRGLSHLVQATQGLVRVPHTGARTRRRWLPDPSTQPQGSLQIQTATDPKLLTLLAFSLLLMSIPGAIPEITWTNSWLAIFGSSSHQGKQEITLWAIQASWHAGHKYAF